MFPYRDENPSERFPLVTLILIGTNLSVWCCVQGFGLDPTVMLASVCQYGVIPNSFASINSHLDQSTVCPPLPNSPMMSLFTMQFLHGGWLHLIGNMMFLWTFGNNIEDCMGHFRFLLFYLLCGVGAAVLHVLSAPTSLIPAIGASGSISGIMGAYLLVFPWARVWMVVFICVYPLRFWLPAWTFLIYWAAVQLFSGLAEFPQSSAGNLPSSGVAFWAHIGGFVAGLILIHVLVDTRFLNRKVHREKFRPWIS